MESVSLLLNLDPMDLHTVVNDIEGPSEIFGTCFTDDPYFIQYLKDAGEGLKEMTSKLLVAGLKIRLSRHTHGPCFLVTPNPSRHHTSEQWRRSLGDTYNTERRRFSVRYDQLSNWINKPSCASTLKEVGSIAVYGEGEVVVGLNEEVEELYQAMGFYQEAVKECCSKLWSPNTALMVFGALQEQLASQFPEVLASPSVDPMMSHSWFIFEGPREDVTLAMEFFHQKTSESLISVTIDEKLLGYQAVFLGELDLEALTMELFQSRGISATLQHREASVVMYAQPIEETGRAINVLKEILQETGIRINQANLAATKEENWEGFLDEVYSRLNNGGQKKLNFYNLLNDNGDTDLVVLVGFRTEVQAAQRLISNYLHNKSQTRRTLTFRQEHLVQAGSQLLEIMEWETSINVKVEVRVAGGSWLEVTLCGSREQVKWAQPFIKKDLEALIQKTVRITEPGAVRFFQEETGTQLLKETGMREQCLILLREETAEGLPTTQNESPEREMRTEAAMHHQDAAELLLIGRLEGVESSAASVQSHFQSTQTLQCLRDPRLCELTPEQLQEVQSRLGVRLRLSEGALTIQGPQDHVTQAKTHIEWLLGEVLHQLSNYLSGYLTSCEILKKFQQWELQQSTNTQQEERMELKDNELPESDQEVEEQQGDQREEKQAFSWLSSYLSGIFTSAKLLDAQPFPCSVSDCSSDASWTETEELKELEQSPGLQLNMNTELQETRAPSTTSQQGSQSIDKKQPSLPAAKPAYQLTDKNTVLSEKPLPTRVNETRAPSTASQQGSQYIEKNTHHPSLPTIEPAYQLTEKNTVLREKPLPTRVNETRAPSTASQQGSQYIEKNTHHPSHLTIEPAYQLTEKNTVLKEKPVSATVKENKAPSTASQQGSQYNQPINWLPNSGHALVPGFAVPSCSFSYTQPALKPAAQSFRCSVCDRHFDTKQGLSSHFTQMHTPEGRSTCPDCGKNSTKSGITRHKCQGKTGTGESKESRPLSCKRELKLSPDCQFNMNTEFGVISTPSTKTQPQFQSNQSTDWDTLRNLNRDDAYLSGILAIAKDLDAAHWSSSFTQPALKPAVQSFCCSVCCRSFESQRGLSIHHTLMHTSTGRATCPSCGKESTKGGITRHKCKGR